MLNKLIYILIKSITIKYFELENTSIQTRKLNQLLFYTLYTEITMTNGLV